MVSRVDDVCDDGDRKCACMGKQNHSSGDPTFLPDKEPGSNNLSAFVDNDDCQAPPTDIFAGRLHSSASIVHARGLSPDKVLRLTSNEIAVSGSLETKEAAEIERLFDFANDLVEEQAAVIEEAAKTEGAFPNHRLA